MTSLPDRVPAIRPAKPPAAPSLLDKLPPGLKSRTAWATSGPAAALVGWATQASAEPLSLRITALLGGLALFGLHAVLRTVNKSVAAIVRAAERNPWTLPALASVPIFRRLASWLPTQPTASTPTKPESYP